MRRVELIYDRDCPNAAATRANLLRAFAEARQPAKWQEWERSSPDAPPYARAFGSPTLLVDSRDVSGELPGGGHDSCRIYMSPKTGLRSGVPDVLTIRQALSRRAGWIKHSAMLPAIGLGLLPKIACPACWPAYAPLLSSVGLGFLLSTKYALALTIASLAIALIAIAAGARRRHGWRPVWLGSAGAAGLIAGRFVWDFAPAAYAGTIMLAIAAVWNGWPRKAAGSCCSDSHRKEVNLYGTQGR